MLRLHFAILLAAILALPYRTLAQHKPSPCPSGASCFVPNASTPEPYDPAATSLLANPAGLVRVQVRMAEIGGPLAHKWVQIGTGENAVTIGYGAANFPLVDTGQIVVADRGGVELVSRWHLFPGHITPAEPPDHGHPVSPPVYVSVAQAQKLIRQQRRHRFLFPYIPLFHDCHTYVCSLMAAVKGKSSLPCYLWFQGHF